MKKILLIPDIPNWAFDIIAKNIVLFLGNKFKFNIKYATNFMDMKNLYEKDYKDYDLIHFFNWNDGRVFAGRKNVTAGVSSHNYELRHFEESKILLPKFQALTTSSMILFNKIKKINQNTHYAAYGINENIFSYEEKKFNKINIGFVGQKSSSKQIGLEQNNLDIKGYNTILKPLMSRFNGNKDINFLLHDNLPKNSISNSSMINFYNQTNFLICTSYREGTPLPVFEGASNGNIILTTNVGCTGELLLKENQNYPYILRQYNNYTDIENTINNFYNIICSLKDNQKTNSLFSKYYSNTVKEKWSWNNMKNNYERFFNEQSK